MLTVKSDRAQDWGYTEELCLEEALRAVDSRAMTVQRLAIDTACSAEDGWLTALDIGCGTGRWVAVISSRHHCLAVGIDNEETCVAQLGRLGFPAVMGDAEKLPFPSATFDVCWSWGLMEHFIRGPEKPLQEAYRILKPGGRLVATVPHAAIWRRLRARLRTQCEGTFVEYRFTRAEWSASLRGMGFVVKSIVPADTCGSALHMDMPLMRSAQPGIRPLNLFGRTASALLRGLHINTSWGILSVAEKPR